MVKLMLYLSAEFEVAALRTLIGRQRDDELRDAPEPFMHLLFHSGFLPTTGAQHYLFVFVVFYDFSILFVYFCKEAL